MGYIQSILGYFGVSWPIFFGNSAFQVSSGLVHSRFEVGIRHKHVHCWLTLGEGSQICEVQASIVI